MERSKNPSPWYDSKEGIGEQVKSLAGLNNLFHERSTAGHEREENLHAFLVLGRYWLGPVGNCVKIEGYIPKEWHPEIPDVMTDDEFQSYIEQHRRQEGPPSIIYLGYHYLPPVGIVCPVCGKLWEIDDCHDTVICDNGKYFYPIDFVGKTLGQMKEHYAEKRDSVCELSTVRNDRFIDLSSKGNTPEEVLGKVVKHHCGSITAEDLTDDYIIHSDDEVYFNVRSYLHSECYKKNLGKEAIEEFQPIFEKAGFKNVKLKTIPNGYCSELHCPPWVEAETFFGPITIGWRKRVVLIKAEKLQRERFSHISFERLFGYDKVTTGEAYVHASTIEKALEYLIRIREQCYLNS